METQKTFNILETVLEALLSIAAVVVTVAWFAGSPLFYYDTEPVMSLFTSLSLFLMAGGRLARKFLFLWPLPISLAILGLVLGGNISSIFMQTSIPPEMMKAFPDIVLTSIMTSIGLILFCLYELLIVLRDTPQSAFIFDDVLLHLALVPGGLSLLGHLFDNPGYLSTGTDPRVGISLMEMAFMGVYAVTAVLSNPQLFLWQFLATSWSNRLVFSALFANQFIAPVVVAFAFSVTPKGGPGVELFVMLAGVIATLVFLLIQAYTQRVQKQS